MRTRLLMTAAVVSLASAAPALAATPPTLTGEVFSAFGYSGSLQLECAPGGNEQSLTMRFRASSSAQGPYAGRFTETGELVMRRTQDFEVQVVSADSEFAIESPAGQVVGRTRLLSHVPGDAGSTLCDEYPARGLHTEEPIMLSYTTTITTTDGVFTDRGTTTMDFEDTSVSYPTEFVQRFTSTLSAPQRQDSVLLGKRTPGASFSAMSANTKRASPFTLYFPSTVRKVHAFLDGGGATSGSQLVRAVLYRRASGSPTAYVTRSFEVSIPAGMSPRWVQFYLAPPATLQPGVYWLGLHSGTTHGVARYAWDSTPGARRFNVDLESDGPSNPFGSALADDQQMSIFASGSY